MKVRGASVDTMGHFHPESRLQICILSGDRDFLVFRLKRRLDHELWELGFHMLHHMWREDLRKNPLALEKGKIFQIKHEGDTTQW